MCVCYDQSVLRKDITDVFTDVADGQSPEWTKTSSAHAHLDTQECNGAQPMAVTDDDRAFVVVLKDSLERRDRPMTAMTAPSPYQPDAPASALSAALTAYDEGWLDDEEINHLLFLVASGLDPSLPDRFERLVDDLIGLADDLIEAGDVSLT
jgi:hypothetical protein